MNNDTKRGRDTETTTDTISKRFRDLMINTTIESKQHIKYPK